MKYWLLFPVKCLLISGFLLFSAISQATGVDSFFDIFYEVSFDENSQGPAIKATARMGDRTSGLSGVETEILAMNLSSHPSGRNSTMHNIVLRYSISNIGSSGEDGVSYGHAELDVTCKAKKQTCSISMARSMSLDEYEHRGHVTVLK